MTMPVLTREAINWMIQSQRIIKKEFGVRIELSDQQAIYRFLAYASKSSSDDLKSYTDKLLEYMATDLEVTTEEEPETKSAAKVRYYRGVPVPVAEAQPEHQPIEANKRHTKEIIYRGQKISY